MIKKIKQWWKRKGFDHYSNYQRGYEDGKVHGEEKFRGMDVFTREQVENAYALGYTDGKRDGLAIAREQATKSLKEILQWQNKTTTTKKQP